MEGGVPSVSIKQRNLMGAALGGAMFPAAKQLRSTMSTSQLKDFAGTKTAGLPLRAKPLKAPIKPIRARGMKVIPTRRTSIGDMYSSAKGTKAGI
jgi:hypothetical protein